MTTPANPLVAQPAADAPSPWAGVWIAEDIDQIVAGVRDRSWVEGTLGVVDGGLDALAMVSDPVGALLQYGIAWLIEHVKPLSEALDWLAGDPAAIAAHAQTWRNVSASLAAEAEELSRAIRWDTTEWTGAAGDAYRSWAGHRSQSLAALGQAASGMALMTEGAGLLIGTVRLMVRDAVATVVSRLIVYAGELIASLGTLTGLVVEQVTTLCAAWGAKIARWLKDLIASLRKMFTESDRLGKLTEKLKTGYAEAGTVDGVEPGKGASESGQGPPHPGDGGFDPAKHHGALGADFHPGVVDPTGSFERKEADIADRLAEDGSMVHARVIENRQNWSNPDSMVRTGPEDVGTVTEFKTLRSGSSTAFKKNMLEAADQLVQHGGGTVVIDGRGVAITMEEAQRGYARAVGQVRVHGGALPDRIRLILGDGTIVDIP